MSEIMGSAIIVMASSKIGYDTANKYVRRVKEIQAFQSGLWGLRSDIGFCQTMLGTALRKVSELVPTNASKVFRDASEKLGEDGDMTAANAWCSALAENEKELSLMVDELSVLYAFGNLLGTSDVSSEMENIEVAIEKLKICENAAKGDEKKYSKMYKGLGVIGGLFLALLFI